MLLVCQYHIQVIYLTYFLDAIGMPMSFDDWLEVLHNVLDVIAYH